MQSLSADSAVVSYCVYWNIMSGPSFSFHTCWGSSGLSAVWERLITQHVLLEPCSAASSFAFLILSVAAIVFTFWHLFFYCSCDLPMLMKIISRLPLCGLYILPPSVFHLVVPSVLTGGQCFFSKEGPSSCKKCIELGMGVVDSDEVKGANCQAVNWPLWAVCLWKYIFLAFCQRSIFVKGTEWQLGIGAD